MRGIITPSHGAGAMLLCLLLFCVPGAGEAPAGEAPMAELMPEYDEARPPRAAPDARIVNDTPVNAGSDGKPAGASVPVLPPVLPPVQGPRQQEVSASAGGPPPLCADVLLGGELLPVESEQSRKNRFRRLLDQAEQLINAGNFELARELCIMVLQEDTGNFRANVLLKKADEGYNQRRKFKSGVEHSKEFNLRLREVEEASIPYVETRKVDMVLKASPYSQEIRMEEESQEISAIRQELNGVLVDLDFRNSDLREVIRYLAEASEVNIVIDETALLQTAQPAQMSQVPQMAGAQMPGFGQQQMQGGIGLAPPGGGAGGAPQYMQPQMAGQPLNQQYPGMQQQGLQQQGFQPQVQQQGFQQQVQQQGFQQPQMQQQYDAFGNPVQNPGAMQQQFQQQQMQQMQGSALVGTSEGVATYQSPPNLAPESPKVTIFLRRVPLLSALDIILRAKNLRYRIEKNYIWISSEQNLALEELVTRIYTIQHAIGDFENFTAEALNLGNLLMNTNTYGGSDSSRFFNNIANSGPQQQYRPPQGERTEAQAAENLISTLKQVVPQPPGAQMTLYARTGKLIVRNTPRNLKVLEGLLRSLDVSSLQVAIEVRLLEVISEEGEDIGATFNLNLKSKGFQTNPQGQITGGERGQLGLNLPPQGLSEMFRNSQDSFSLVFDQAGTIAINASIRALLAQNKATLLSSPKLTCLNNQTANIQVATVQNYIAAQESNVVTGTSTSNTSTSQTIGQIPEGITLELTPNVSADQRTIRLTVHPKVTELKELESVIGYDDRNNPYVKNQLPKVTQRSLDTTVSVRNGGTLVLGGLMRGKTQNKSQAISGASRLPVVGGLFRNRNEYDAKSNLIIFITARILNAEGDIVDVEFQEETPDVELR